MFFLYNVLILLTSPVWVVWMLIRSRRRAESPNWQERFGNYRHIKIPKDKPAIWIHAVSVGEVVASLPVLRQIRALLPDHHIVLSVTTSSGHRTAREHAVEMYDSLVYFPLDLARFQLSALMRVRPDVVAVMETELWFNFLWAAKAVGAKTLLLNGRISDRSFPRSQKLGSFYKALLAMMDRCLMQSKVDADRIMQLGGQNVEVLGNVKFDQAIDGLDADRNEWLEALGLSPLQPTVVIGSSRGEDEERVIASALKSVKSPFNLVWAPRHIERTQYVLDELKQICSHVALRSKAEKGTVVILDSYGELSKVYAVADVVVIGGSFADLGGQNLIQPLAHGKPVLHGRFMQNFREVTALANRAGATVQCNDANDLAAAIDQLLNDPEARRAMGRAGATLVQENEGASRKYALAVAEAVKS